MLPEMVEEARRRAQDWERARTAPVEYRKSFSRPKAHYGPMGEELDSEEQAAARWRRYEARHNGETAARVVEVRDRVVVGSRRSGGSHTRCSRRTPRRRSTRRTSSSSDPPGGGQGDDGEGEGSGLSRLRLARRLVALLNFRGDA
jgi:hypothetical protein